MVQAVNKMMPPVTTPTIQLRRSAHQHWLTVSTGSWVQDPTLKGLVTITMSSSSECHVENASARERLAPRGHVLRGERVHGFV